MDETQLTPKPVTSPMKLFRAVSLIAVLSLFFTSVDLYTGTTSERYGTIRQATDPVRFNFEVGALMVIAAGSSVYWYILLLRILRERRDRRISPGQEK